MTVRDDAQPIGESLPEALTTLNRMKSTGDISQTRRPPTEHELEHCPKCERRHRLDKRYLGRRYLCERCEAVEVGQQSWSRLRGPDLMDAVLRCGVGQRFCRGGRPPSLSDPGLAELIGSRELPTQGGYFFGSVGRHKTHLLAARTVEAASRGLSARMVNWSDLLIEIRATYQPGAKNCESDVLNGYSNLDYLGIDDLGIGRDGSQETANALRVAYVLFDRRYNSSEKVTDVASNLTPIELAERFDARIARRIRESCEEFPMMEGV